MNLPVRFALTVVRRLPAGHPVMPTFNKCR